MMEIRIICGFFKKEIATRNNSRRLQYETRSQIQTEIESE